MALLVEVRSAGAPAGVMLFAGRTTGRESCSGMA
jgi:hypothetical protein